MSHLAIMDDMYHEVTFDFSHYIIQARSTLLEAILPRRMIAILVFKFDFHISTQCHSLPTLLRPL